MSLMDKIKAFFSGSADRDDDKASSYLQTPSDPDAPVMEPSPEEVAAAMQAEPPTRTVEALSEDEPGSGEPKDEVH